MIRAEGTGRGRSNETLHSPCSRPQSIPLPCKRWLIIQFTRPGTQWMISFHLRPQAETSDDTDGCLPGQRPCTPATPSVLLATTLPAGRTACKPWTVPFAPSANETSSSCAVGGGTRARARCRRSLARAVSVFLSFSRCQSVCHDRHAQARFSVQVISRPSRLHRFSVV